MEKAGDHGRRGKHLRHDADKNANEEKEGANRFGTTAILTRHNLEKGGAVALAQATSVEQCQHQRTEGGTEGEPQRGNTETESQLGCTDGGLAANQGAENGSAYHPRARTATGSEAFFVLDFTARENAHRQQQTNSEKNTNDMYRRYHALPRWKKVCKGTFFL